MSPATHRYSPPADRELELLYLDQQLLAVNKPAGLLTVPGRGPDKQDCLLHRLHRQYPECLVVHRLDMETSGIVLFARNARTQGRLGKWFADRSIQKEYVALVSGKPPADAGEIDLPLTADWPNRPKQKVDPQRGKPSLTRYRLVDYDATTDISRLELQPVTGRSHQLRVHLQALGCPVLGDRLYHPDPGGRLMLHACRLRIAAGTNGETLDVECPAPF